MKARGTVVEMPKIYYASSELKRYLHCSDEYLKKLRDTAKVTFYRDGKMIWYNINSVNNYIEKHKVINARI